MIEKKALMNTEKRLNYNLTCYAEYAVGITLCTKSNCSWQQNRYAYLIPAVILE